MRLSIRARLSLEKNVERCEANFKNRGSKIDYGTSITNHFIEEHLMTWENAHENAMVKKLGYEMVRVCYV